METYHHNQTRHHSSISHDNKTKTTTKCIKKKYGRVDDEIICRLDEEEGKECLLGGGLVDENHTTLE